MLSQFTAKRFEDFCSRSGIVARCRTEVLYPPLSVNADTRPDPKPSTRTGRSSFFLENWPTALHVVGAVAPLSRRKNLKVLFEALEIVEKQSSDFGLALVAPPVIDVDRDTLELLERLNRKLGNRLTVYAELDDEVYDVFLRRITAMAVPSLLEGFGLPIVEAAIRRVPVLAASSSSLSELGRLLDIRTLDPKSPKEWAEAILNFGTDEFSAGDPRRVLPTPFRFRQELMSLQQNAGLR